MGKGNSDVMDSGAAVLCCHVMDSGAAVLCCHVMDLEGLVCGVPY